MGRLISKQKEKNTWDSNVVPHRSTNQARGCLTSLSRREAVLSSWYGRSCLHQTSMQYITHTHTIHTQYTQIRTHTHINMYTLYPIYYAQHQHIHTSYPTYSPPTTYPLFFLQPTIKLHILYTSISSHCHVVMLSCCHIVILSYY